jgi:hypothetical protein
VGNDPRRQSKVTVPNDAWTGKFEQVTHFRLRAERLLGLHIEGLTLPKLLRFTFSNRTHSYSRDDKGPRDDTLVADFIRRHGASLERIGVQFRRVLGRSFFDFEAELPNLIGIYVVGRWDEDTAPGGSALPFQNVIDKRAAYLEELSIARFPPGDPSGGECSYLEDLFTRTSELSCPPALTRVKLALPFNITPTFWTWFARLLPQLTVFWLPQCILDNGKLVELVGGLRTPPPLEDLMLLSDDKIEERCETLARLFPRIDKLKFILESITSSADYVTTMASPLSLHFSFRTYLSIKVPECEPRFKQMYLKNAVNRNPKWAATEFGIRQYPVGEISNTRLLAYLYAGHAQQGIDLRLIKVDDWPFGFY